MTNIKKILIVLSVVIVAVILLSFLSGKLPKETEEDVYVAEVVKEQVPGFYESETFGFSFRYPEELFLQEASTTSIVLIETIESKGAIVEVDVISLEGADMPFEQFALDESRLLCGKISPLYFCSEVRDISSYTNENGKEAIKFYVVLDEDSSGGKVSKEKGPFYAFNISEKTPGKMSFVLVRPPLHKAGSVAEINETASKFNF